MKKIVSIDLWNTLIKSNPEFRIKKIEFFKELGIDEETIKYAFYNTKAWVNQTILNTRGFQIDVDTIFGHLHYLLNINNQLTHNKVTCNILRNKYEILFLNEPPLLIGNVDETLEKFQDKFTYILSSNTMFINGYLLRLTIARYDIERLFSSFCFSDELKVAKPNPKMCGNADYHIGDNYYFDFINDEKIKSIIINEKCTLENVLENL